MTYAGVGFQSTCPARGTTFCTLKRICTGAISIHVPREGHDFLRPCRLYPRINFNPRAPRGARRRLWERVEVDVYFNPRAPRGARLDPLHKRFKVCRFQSTCPARGTTHKFGAIKNDLPISIHVPREGHDLHSASGLPISSYFNPRAPRGARLHRQQIAQLWSVFQSTCPARGTTFMPAASSSIMTAFQSTCPARGTT